MNLEALQTLLIDGDGVLWRSDEAIPGLKRFFSVLENRNIEWALLTNNSTRSADQYIEKMRIFGITASVSKIFSSGTVTTIYLRERFTDGGAVYVIGESGFKKTLSENGFVVHDGDKLPSGIVAVVVSLDRYLTYDKLKIASLLIRNSVPFIATNIDRTLPTPNGLTPGTGSTLAALIAATEIEPTVIGKPGPMLYKTAMASLKADPSTTAMLGDRLETDILGAQRIGIGTIVVLTGIATRKELSASDIQPDFVYENIAELADALEIVTTSD
jgi:4-nitrophenyl phosphatase